MAFTNISLILWSLIALILIYKAVRWSFYKPAGFPPGPPRLPLVGSYLFLLMLNYKHLHKAALKLGQIYKTKIIGMYYASIPLVVLNDYKLIKEAFTRPEFDGKPDIYLIRARDENEVLRGIFFTEGQLWKEQRWFMLRYLRDFGFGRRHEELEANIRDELTGWIDMIRNGPKYPHEHEIVSEPGLVKLPLILSTTLGNCFFLVLLSEAVPRADQAAVLETAKASLKFQRVSDSYGRLVSVIPWLKDYFPDKTDYNKLKKVNETLRGFIGQILKKQISTYEEGHVRNFIDLYIAEMKKREATGEAIADGFYYDQFVFSVLDFFIPALTAIAAQIGLLVQTTMRQPEIARNIQNEIDTVVGHGRLPTLDDRMNMPYTEAAIREVMRYETPLPSGLAHKVLKDTTLGGYNLPAGTVVVPGHYAMHIDKELWGDPENFRPERFLTSDGKVDLKKDITMPFGAGKRLCAGETFARNIMFLYVSSMYQNFDFSLRPNESIDDIKRANSVGLITSTPDFWVRFNPR